DLCSLISICMAFPFLTLHVKYSDGFRQGQGEIPHPLLISRHPVGTQAQKNRRKLMLSAT
ncbi:MAG: hypothetical protein VXY53_06170, partial [Candidatus Thermoplasmatota archaeon]|nr:hypothetical protein [Candidatus Thermoplasmatota archaeon]